MPVYADRPVCFDQSGKLVGWENAALRDTVPRIESGVEWEIGHFKGEVRVGLEASFSERRTWKNFRAFHEMIKLQ